MINRNSKIFSLEIPEAISKADRALISTGSSSPITVAIGIVPKSFNIVRIFANQIFATSLMPAPMLTLETPGFPHHPYIPNQLKPHKNQIHTVEIDDECLDFFDFMESPG